MTKPIEQKSIGVFDSGVGGLTVVKALKDLLPAENIAYLGDTARVPYGTKSAHTVTRYALQAARPLTELGIKCLVVACNTASSVALTALRQTYHPIPVIGVIEPGAAAGCLATRTGHIGVLATEGTVRGGAYQTAINRLAPTNHISSQTCSLLVSLAEEGFTDDDIAQLTVKHYLSPMLCYDFHPVPIDCFILGCTHFPLLSSTIQAMVGPHIKLVDSAATTAMTVKQTLNKLNLLRQSPQSGAPVIGELQLMVTDNPQRFAKVGSHFLGNIIHKNNVEVIDL